MLRTLHRAMGFTLSLVLVMADPVWASGASEALGRLCHPPVQNPTQISHVDSFLPQALSPRGDVPTYSLDPIRSPQTLGVLKEAGRRLLDTDLARNFHNPNISEIRDIAVLLDAYPINILLAALENESPDSLDYDAILGAIKFNLNLGNYQRIRDLFERKGDPRLDAALANIQFLSVLTKKGDSSNARRRLINPRSFEGRNIPIFQTAVSFLKQLHDYQAGEKLLMELHAVGQAWDGLDAAQIFADAGITNASLLACDKSFHIYEVEGLDPRYQLEFNGSNQLLQAVPYHPDHDKLWVRWPSADYLPAWKRWYAKRVLRKYGHIRMGVREAPAADISGLEHDFRALRKMNSSYIKAVSLRALAVDAYAQQHPIQPGSTDSPQLGFEEVDVFNPPVDKPKVHAKFVLGLWKREYEYFQDKTIREGLRIQGRGLREGGYLFVGQVGERILGQFTERADPKKTFLDVYQRQGNRLVLVHSEGYKSDRGWREINLYQSLTQDGMTRRTLIAGTLATMGVVAAGSIPLLAQQSKTKVKPLQIPGLEQQQQVNDKIITSKEDAWHLKDAQFRIDRYEELLDAVMNNDPDISAMFYQHRIDWETLIATIISQEKYETEKLDQLHGPGAILLGSHDKLFDTIGYERVEVGRPQHTVQTAEAGNNENKAIWFKAWRALKRASHGVEFYFGAAVQKGLIENYKKAYDALGTYAELENVIQKKGLAAIHADFDHLEEGLSVQEQTENIWLAQRSLQRTTEINTAIGAGAEEINEKGAKVVAETGQLTDTKDTATTRRDALIHIVSFIDAQKNLHPYSGPLPEISRNWMADRAGLKLSQQGRVAENPLPSAESFRAALQQNWNLTPEQLSDLDYLSPDALTQLAKLLPQLEVLPTTPPPASQDNESTKAFDVSFNPQILADLVKKTADLKPGETPRERVLQIHQETITQVDEIRLDLETKGDGKVGVHPVEALLPLLAGIVDFEYRHPDVSTVKSLKDLKKAEELRAGKIQRELEAERKRVLGETQFLKNEQRKAWDAMRSTYDEIVKQSQIAFNEANTDWNYAPANPIPPLLKIQALKQVYRRQALKVLRYSALLDVYSPEGQKRNHDKTLQHNLQALKQLMPQLDMTRDQLNPPKKAPTASSTTPSTWMRKLSAVTVSVLAMLGGVLAQDQEQPPAPSNNHVWSDFFHSLWQGLHQITPLGWAVLVAVAVGCAVLLFSGINLYRRQPKEFTRKGHIQRRFVYSVLSILAGSMIVSQLSPQIFYSPMFLGTVVGPLLIMFPGIYRDKFQGRPWWSGIYAIGAGALVAWLLPPLTWLHWPHNSAVGLLTALLCLWVATPLRLIRMLFFGWPISPLFLFEKAGSWINAVAAVLILSLIPSYVIGTFTHAKEAVQRKIHKMIELLPGSYGNGVSDVMLNVPLPPVPANEEFVVDHVSVPPHIAQGDPIAAVKPSYEVYIEAILHNKTEWQKHHPGENLVAPALLSSQVDWDSYNRAPIQLVSAAKDGSMDDELKKAVTSLCSLLQQYRIVWAEAVNTRAAADVPGASPSLKDAAANAAFNVLTLDLQIADQANQVAIILRKLRLRNVFPALHDIDVIPNTVQVSGQDQGQGGTRITGGSSPVLFQQELKNKLLAEAHLEPTEWGTEGRLFSGPGELRFSSIGADGKKNIHHLPFSAIQGQKLEATTIPRDPTELLIWLRSFFSPLIDTPNIGSAGVFPMEVIAKRLPGSVPFPHDLNFEGVFPSPESDTPVRDTIPPDHRFAIGSYGELPVTQLAHPALADVLGENTEMIQIEVDRLQAVLQSVKAEQQHYPEDPRFLELRSQLEQKISDLNLQLPALDQQQAALRAGVSIAQPPTSKTAESSMVFPKYRTESENAAMESPLTGRSAREQEFDVLGLGVKINIFGYVFVDDRFRDENSITVYFPALGRSIGGFKKVGFIQPERNYTGVMVHLQRDIEVGKDVTHEELIKLPPGGDPTSIFSAFIVVDNPPQTNEPGFFEDLLKLPSRIKRNFIRENLPKSSPPTSGLFEKRLDLVASAGKSSANWKLPRARPQGVPRIRSHLSRLTWSELLVGLFASSVFVFISHFSTGSWDLGWAVGGFGLGLLGHELGHGLWIWLVLRNSQALPDPSWKGIIWKERIPGERYWKPINSVSAQWAGRIVSLIAGLPALWLTVQVIMHNPVIHPAFWYGLTPASLVWFLIADSSSRLSFHRERPTTHSAEAGLEPEPGPPSLQQDPQSSPPEPLDKEELIKFSQVVKEPLPGELEWLKEKGHGTTYLTWWQMMFLAPLPFVKRLPYKPRKMLERLYQDENISWWRAYWLNAKYWLQSQRRNAVDEIITELGVVAVVVAAVVAVWNEPRLVSALVVAQRTSGIAPTVIAFAFVSLIVLTWLIFGGWFVAAARYMSQLLLRGAWIALRVPVTLFVEIIGLERGFHKLTRKPTGEAEPLEEIILNFHKKPKTQPDQPKLLDRFAYQVLEPLAQDLKELDTLPGQITFLEEEVQRLEERRAEGKKKRKTAKDLIEVQKALLQTQERYARSQEYSSLKQDIADALFLYSWKAPENAAEGLIGADIPMPDEEDLAMQLETFHQKKKKWIQLWGREQYDLCKEARVTWAMDMLLKKPLGSLMALLAAGYDDVIWNHYQGEDRDALRSQVQEVLKNLKERLDTLNHAGYDGVREQDRIKREVQFVELLLASLEKQPFKLSERVREALERVVDKTNQDDEMKGWDVLNHKARAQESAYIHRKTGISLTTNVSAEIVQMARLVPIAAFRGFARLLGRRMNKSFPEDIQGDPDDKIPSLMTELDPGAQNLNVPTYLAKKLIQGPQGLPVTETGKLVAAYRIGSSLLDQIAKTFGSTAPFGPAQLAIDSADTINRRQLFIDFLRWMHLTPSKLFLVGASPAVRPYLDFFDRYKYSRLGPELAKRVETVDVRSQSGTINGLLSDPKVITFSSVEPNSWEGNPDKNIWKGFSEAKGVQVYVPDPFLMNLALVHLWGVVFPELQESMFKEAEAKLIREIEDKKDSLSLKELEDLAEQLKRLRALKRWVRWVPFYLEDMHLRTRVDNGPNPEPPPVLTRKNLQAPYDTLYIKINKPLDQETAPAPRREVPRPSPATPPASPSPTDGVKQLHEAA